MLGPAQGLLMVDMQVEYFADEGLAQCRPMVVEACNAVIRAARQAGAPIFEVRTLHKTDRTTWTLNMLEDDEGMVIEGTEGSAPLPELDTQDAIVISKTRDSAFCRTKLETMLKKRGIKTIALCGISTESCVAMTAAEAYARDLYVMLVDEALASADPASHDHTLAHLSEQYRQPVVSVEEIRFTRPTSFHGARPARHSG